MRTFRERPGTARRRRSGSRPNGAPSVGQLEVDGRARAELRIPAPRRPRAPGRLRPAPALRASSSAATRSTSGTRFRRPVRGGHWVPVIRSPMASGARAREAAPARAMRAPSRLSPARRARGSRGRARSIRSCSRRRANAPARARPHAGRRSTGDWQRRVGPPPPARAGGAQRPAQLRLPRRAARAPARSTRARERGARGRAPIGPALPAPRPARVGVARSFPARSPRPGPGRPDASSTRRASRRATQGPGARRARRPRESAPGRPLSKATRTRSSARRSAFRGESKRSCTSAQLAASNSRRDARSGHRAASPRRPRGRRASSPPSPAFGVDPTDLGDGAGHANRAGDTGASAYQSGGRPWREPLAAGARSCRTSAPASKARRETVSTGASTAGTSEAASPRVAKERPKPRSPKAITRVRSGRRASGGRPRRRARRGTSRDPAPAPGRVLTEARGHHEVRRWTRTKR